jgi:GTP cyclohydrolase I
MTRYFERLTIERDRLGENRLTELERTFGDFFSTPSAKIDIGRASRKRCRRAARLFEFLTQGYRQCVEDVVNGAIFDSDASEIVMVKDIELYSICEHHLLPFIGRAHVAYIPNGRVIGLSKVARIVDVFARRLQIQEQLTTQVADALMEALHPLGVAVVIEGSISHDDARRAEAELTRKTSCLLGCSQRRRVPGEFLSLAQPVTGRCG